MYSAIALISYMHIWFFFAILKKRNDLADIAWGLGFLLLGIVEYFSLGAELNPRSLLVLFLVLIWSVRLSTYIAMRSSGKPEDPRYTDMRNGWGEKWISKTYVRVFWLQGILLFILAQPLLAALRLPGDPLNLVDILAALYAMTGFIIEAVADDQKNRFKAKPQNRGKICDVGLWSKSRHPNYFGEITFWIGISIFSLQYAKALWWVWFSPALLILLLLKVSGVPLIEKRYAGRQDYEDYKKRTNLLMPV